MNVGGRSCYRYVGPADLKAAVRPGSGGRRIGSAADFTHPMVFRRRPGCQEHNIVREDDFVRVFCGSDLPKAWNIDADSRC
ncbi:hypothetical protein [Streptomyces pakalii]|uniref:Uncharacterized protein n=1 Tax=Streptomyces pakalii TaxID=3036494 RepID=A0ABT7D5U4_9ACTN|nr:hypothetical protein [Streptomyces pakalii]MDJ1641174.1 hypothetical protein [Streptomyces pakalii]